MAFIGLRKPYVAKYDRSTNAYSDGFRYSHAVSMNVTPNYSEASLYGDDEQVEYEKSFTNANIELGTTSTPIQAANVMFGHEVDLVNNKVIFKATDDPNYVGVGAVVPEKVDGVRKFIGVVFPCVKFSDSAESYNTKGDQLQFGTPTISGLGIPDASGEWKITRTYDNESDAMLFVMGFLGISPTLTLSASTLSVVEDETGTLTATTDPVGLTVAWTSSDDTVATVANGVVTGVAAGSATITATVGSVTATCTVTVTAA